jgi:hypothetical protein
MHWLGHTTQFKPQEDTMSEPDPKAIAAKKEADAIAAKQAGNNPPIVPKK